MRSTQNRAVLETWTRLQSRIGESFTAHRRGVRGLVARELTLLYGDGRKLGWLKPNGLGGAHLEVGGLAAEIERSPGVERSYRMWSFGAELLSVKPGGAAPKLYSLAGTYDMRVNLLWNSAAVRISGREPASLDGSFTGLRYRVALPDGGAPLVLPAALFLLYYVPALRSRAYRAR